MNTHACNRNTYCDRDHIRYGSAAKTDGYEDCDGRIGDYGGDGPLSLTQLLIIEPATATES